MDTYRIVDKNGRVVAGPFETNNVRQHFESLNLPPGEYIAQKLEDRPEWVTTAHLRRALRST